MRRVTLEINSSIYDYIMFFLKNIPNDLINIYFDNNEEKIDYKSKKRSLRGAFQSYADQNK